MYTHGQATKHCMLGSQPHLRNLGLSLTLHAGHAIDKFAEEFGQELGWGFGVPVAARGCPPEVSMVTASWHCSICTLQLEDGQCCCCAHTHIQKTVLDHGAVAKAASDGQMAGHGKASGLEENVQLRVGCSFW